jgi:hypothetical protein
VKKKSGDKFLEQSKTSNSVKGEKIGAKREQERERRK